MQAEGKECGDTDKWSDSGCIPQAAFQTLIDKMDVNCKGKGGIKMTPRF